MFEDIDDTLCEELDILVSEKDSLYLTEWEDGFLDSVKDNEYLSIKQLAVIKNMYRKHIDFDG